MMWMWQPFIPPSAAIEPGRAVLTVAGHVSSLQSQINMPDEA